ncbi:hypothetical protein EK21DRAFT_63319 [Setomelanomma holmii]|uniref:Uncharacterized protein n=1 Tax=Setomelanomma holmii TaxID=210430 RepID=A0A9P4HB74_9PLEO|nr:hypothetical protein EK21DRAFT_63319 [Setomelanomma holmii]
MPVVEFGLMGVQPNHPVTNLTTPSGQILQRAWDAVVGALNGPRWAFGGVEVDNAERLWGFFEFESVEQHAEFAKTFGAEAVKDLPKILNKSMFQKHIDVGKDFRNVLQPECTEIVLVYFNSKISGEEQEQASETVEMIADMDLRSCVDVKAVSVGWSIENDFPVLGGEEGQAGKVLGVFVGWESVDARKKVRETEGNGDYMKKIAGIGGVLTTATRLVACKEFGKEG